MRDTNIMFDIYTQKIQEMEKIKNKNIFPNFNKTLNYQIEGYNFNIRLERTRTKHRSFLKSTC